jgi:hypothetical protein
MTFHDVMDALLSAELPMSTCRQYHVRKAMVRPPLAAGRVVLRQASSLTVELVPPHPLYDVKVSHVVLTCNGEERFRVPVPGPLDDDTYCVPPPFCVVLDGLAPGTTYTLGTAWVVENPLVAATLPSVHDVTVDTLPPPTPVVVGHGPTHVCVRGFRMGLGLGIVLDVNGARWGGPGTVEEGEDAVSFRVDGLQPASDYTVTLKCKVDAGDAGFSMPWSAEVRATCQVLDRYLHCARPWLRQSWSVLCGILESLSTCHTGVDPRPHGAVTAGNVHVLVVEDRGVSTVSSALSDAQGTLSLKISCRICEVRIFPCRLQVVACILRSQVLAQPRTTSGALGSWRQTWCFDWNSAAEPPHAVLHSLLQVRRCNLSVRVARGELHESLLLSFPTNTCGCSTCGDVGVARAGAPVGAVRSSYGRPGHQHPKPTERQHPAQERGASRDMPWLLVGV